MGVVDETVQDGVGVGRIADDFVPTVDRKLGGDHLSRQALWPSAEASQLLPNSCRTDEDQIVVGVDPVALDQLLEPRAIKTASAVAYLRGVFDAITGDVLPKGAEISCVVL